MKRSEQTKLMSEAMYLVPRYGRQHVVTTSYYSRLTTDYSTGAKIRTVEPNYLKDGKSQAFCGILKEGQTLGEFREDWKNKKVEQVIYSIK